MAKSPIHIVEDELYKLWNLGYRSIDEVTWRLSGAGLLTFRHRTGYSTFLERQLIDVAKYDQEVAAFACAMGILAEFPEENIDQRLASFALAHGRQTSMSARRWARQGVKKFARSLLSHASLIEVVGVRVTTVSGRVIVRVQSLIGGGGATVRRDYFLDRSESFPLDIHLTDTAVLSFDWTPYQKVEFSVPEPSSGAPLDFQLHWEGNVSIVFDLDVPAPNNIRVEQYPSSTYVSIAPPMPRRKRRTI